MALMGLLVTFVGFLLAVASVGITSSVGARLILVLIGLAMSLTGIIGITNKAYLQNAIWKKK